MDELKLPPEMIESIEVGDTLELPPLFNTMTKEPVFLLVTSVEALTLRIEVQGVATYFGITLRKMTLTIRKDTGVVQYGY